MTSGFGWERDTNSPGEKCKRLRMFVLPVKSVKSVVKNSPLCRFSGGFVPGGAVMAEMAQASFEGAMTSKQVKAQDGDCERGAQTRPDPVNPPALPERRDQFRS